MWVLLAGAWCLEVLCPHGSRGGVIWESPGPLLAFIIGLCFREHCASTEGIVTGAAGLHPPSQSSEPPFGLCQDCPSRLGEADQQAAGLCGLHPGNWGWRGVRESRAAANACPSGGPDPDQLPWNVYRGKCSKEPWGGQLSCLITQDCRFPGTVLKTEPVLGTFGQSATWGRSGEARGLRPLRRRSGCVSGHREGRRPQGRAAG